MFVDKIVCVGKNYLEHARELGDAVPEKPVLFLKPSSVLRQVEAWGDELHLDFFPDDTMVQPECEIALRIAHDGYQMTIKEAKQAIAAVTLGLDMTLRARQTVLKKQGHPWTTAKVFKDAAVLGPWIPYNQFKNYMDSEFKLFINGTLKQNAKGSEMMMPPEALLVYISHFFPLKAGDIIYTGTPAGVTSITPETKAQLQWGDLSYTVCWH